MHVEFAGAARGQFLKARGVRQGCPASGFLRSDLPMAPRVNYPKEPGQLGIFEAYPNVLTLTTSLLHQSLLGQRFVLWMTLLASI